MAHLTSFIYDMEKIICNLLCVLDKIDAFQHFLCKVAQCSIEKVNEQITLFHFFIPYRTFFPSQNTKNFFEWVNGNSVHPLCLNNANLTNCQKYMLRHGSSGYLKRLDLFSIWH